MKVKDIGEVGKLVKESEMGDPKVGKIRDVGKIGEEDRDG